MGDIMISTKKKIAVLFSTMLVMGTSVANATTTFAETTDALQANSSEVSNSNVSNNVKQGSSQETDNANNTNNIAITQASSSYDVAAIKSEIINETNRLRSQNGLNPLTDIGFLDTYAQKRADTLSDANSLDYHKGWSAIPMAPYNQDAEENILLMPIANIDGNASTIAKGVIKEFYQEKNDPDPNYGHRKNLLNPYVGFMGTGVTITSGGVIYVAQEMGNDDNYAERSSILDRNKYYYTHDNYYSNVSKYDLSNSERNTGNAAQDYTQTNNYTFVDLRGGVSTLDNFVNIYSKNGKQYTNVRLAPNTDWYSDIMAIINGTYYFHVSTDGYVLATDILPWATFLHGKIIRANSNAMIYNDYGNPTTDHVSADTKWSTDRRSINLTANVKYYRIGTNAWLRGTDVTDMATVKSTTNS
ncbi:CAP domain-containing protein [Lactobacillus salsicarnum]|uniref:CAP domain-containing protein n=2 Tax=Companilactobacillus mishanensis TaxID=2486008 RepID=A0ABW9P4V6_9LACO|nr:CAP domain-containing protein [Companilactobacillus mishanensis]